MNRKSKRDAKRAQTSAPVAVPTEPKIEAAAEAAAIAEIDHQIALPKSVVRVKYKVRYKDRAIAAGIKGKAAKRSTWDWLAQELAAATLTKSGELRVDDFLAILEANGVDHSRWTNRSKGWQGRLRMTGRLALARVVAESGVLRYSKEAEDWKPAPADWIAKHLH